MIIVSSCLLGVNAKYNGDTNTNKLLLKYSHLAQYLPICPEQLGGLTTPRSPVEIQNGTGADVLAGTARAKNDQGLDVTSQFRLGAEQALYLTRIMPVTAAILKARSPSCGSRGIYDGTFNHIAREGQGVTAALLSQHNIPVYSDEELTEELLQELLR